MCVCGGGGGEGDMNFDYFSHDLSVALPFSSAGYFY